jgi:hypothetical protein
MDTVSKPQSILVTQQPLPRENNEYLPSVRYSSNANKVELPPFMNNSDEYDDLIAYEATSRNTKQTDLKWTRTRILVLIMVLIIFILSLVISILSTSLFHSKRSGNTDKFNYLFSN